MPNLARLAAIVYFSTFRLFDIEASGEVPD
jgi:hypothetical protein